MRLNEEFMLLSEAQEILKKKEKEDEELEELEELMDDYPIGG